MDKLGPRSDKCYFIGYPKETKGYYFYLADEQKVFVSLEAIFLEKKFLGEGTVAAKIELGKVQPVKEHVHSKDITESAVSESHLKSTSRRSDIVPHQSDRYYSFLIWDGDPIKLDENDEDLITYIDAM